MKYSHDSVRRIAIQGILREFLAPDIEGVEGIGTVGAMLEQGFLRLFELFPTLIFSESVTTQFDSDFKGV